LANSIVIIDELQAYNPEHWDKIKYFIAKYAELFNIQFIIMSATLPKIDEIELSGYKPKPFVSLISDAKNYLQNPNFAGRVKIKTNLLNKKIELSELANIVLEKSKKYAETRNDGYLGSVHTIIEFIFKKSASAFFRELQKCEDENGKFYDEIFVLSGTILEARRKYIIDFLKAPRNKNTKVLLITTQVVEAGVDIDMDLGFKNQSLIDSDEQLAGRINRNINKQNCELFLFKHDSPKRIYGDDLRYQETEKFDAKRIKDILSNKSFDELYKKVFAGIFKTNISAYKKGLDEYLDNFSRFDFKGIHHDFRLIDSQNVNIFVPIDIPVNGYSTKSFSDKEFEWITKNNCLENTNFVSGEKMWERYVSIIENKELEFTQKNYELKILNGIMSNFVFSVFIYKLSDLSEFIENPRTDESKFQLYYKLRKEGLSNIYTIEGGLNEEYLEIKSGQRFDFI
jgi:CRISPR-associated endonuclease/helicase Cas3